MRLTVATISIHHSRGKTYGSYLRIKRPPGVKTGRRWRLPIGLLADSNQVVIAVGTPWAQNSQINKQRVRWIGSGSSQQPPMAPSIRIYIPSNIVKLLPEAFSRKGKILAELRVVGRSIKSIMAIIPSM